MVTLPDFRDRLVADSTDRAAWLRARSRGVTATDAAKLSSDTAVRQVVFDKRNGNGFAGNAYTEHGRRREPVLAAWVLRRHGIAASGGLFHARDAELHLATPDGVALRAGGEIVLAEIKTTSKPWRSIPRNYLRQVWWQQYVLGAERTLVVWEQHENFVPISDEPKCLWVDRDESQIHLLVGRANAVLTELGRSATV